jgi:hypothetical protein
MNHHRRLSDQVQEVAERYRRLFGWLACTVVWLAAAMIGAALMQIQWQFSSIAQWFAPVLLVAAVLTSAVACWLAIRPTWDRRWTARCIEAKHPELDTLLVTAVEQEPQTGEAKFGFLQDRVFREALKHNRETAWQNDVSDGRILTIQLTGLASFGMLAFVIACLATQGAQANRVVGLAPELEPTVSITAYKMSIAPGDVDIERGTSLVVTAQFSGDLPDDAVLKVRDDSGETLSVPMSLSLSDPIFGARVPGVQADLAYWIEFAEQKTREFQVTVFEYPELTRADAELKFPKYTALPEKRVEDTRRITAVEGTEVTLFCDLNKPVQLAYLIDEEDGMLELKATDDDPTVYSVVETLAESKRYQLILVDEEERQNRAPPQVVFNVTPNREPDVKITMPAKDVRVSPIEELQTKASLWDDYGLRAYGVNYTLPGQTPKELTLGESTASNERREVDHLIPFEDLKAEPDQLLAYYFWAEDVGPDGKPRRALGDMYFAEVRHFEEIFRQGEQPPSGQSQEQQQQQSGQNARQAEELAELQKQIINATWTLIRRETGPQPASEFQTDMEEIKTAQADALDKLAELVEDLEDPQSQQHAATVESHMLRAMMNLARATDTSSLSVLPQALSSEQAAYQALLKLRAREHQVTRGQPQQQQQQQSGSASGAQSRAQRQLEQLELDNEQNRYETERQASPQQDQQQRENLQVLNRLRELARRQNDLNERLKELQSALEEAQTEEEEEDIRQQLKRLREQQQQMLRDMDELAERMEQPQNQERMSEQRQQVEQTREQIRQTTEALRDGQVSEAVASGTRAQRELEELEEEFRDTASNQFSDEVERLRDDARQLDEREQKLAEQLRDQSQAKRDTRSLREPTERPDLGEDFRRQREDLERLLEDIRETVEEAEEAEPLMARQLYDSAREARQQRVDDALDVTRQLLDRGLATEARAAEEHAARGIESLREGVESAAESVLGREDEALRRAQQTLEDLAQELNEEIRRATGQPAEGEPEDSQREPGQQTSQRPGEQQGEPRQPSEQQQAGRRQEGEPRDGRPGSGQRREGEQQEQTEQASRDQNDPQEGQPGGQGGRQPDEGQVGERQSTLQPMRESEENRPPGPNGLRDGRPQSRQQGRAGQQNQTPTGIEQFRGPNGPITGDFLPWSDRLRDVEEMVDDPKLRGEVARVREAARDIRREMRRDFKGPNWDVVREFVAQPLNELRDRVAEELLRKNSNEPLVPIDRDPVPAKYAEEVRRYYETLGSGQ